VWVDRNVNPVCGTECHALTPNGQDEEDQERGETWATADGVQCCPAVQEPLVELGVFIQGGIEEALVGGEDDD
jgi:hypothetical protein